jgi:hypothetical protein
MIHFEIQKALTSIGRSLANELGYDLVVNGYGDSGEYSIDPSKSFVRVDVLWNEKSRTNLDDNCGGLANHPLQVMIMTSKSHGEEDGENISYRAAVGISVAKDKFPEGLMIGPSRVFKTFPSPLLFEDGHIGYALTVQVESIE